MQQTRFLFFSSKTLRLIWSLVLCSQLTVIAFAALDYSGSETISITKEGEEPKPLEGKAFTDLIEESKFLVTEIPVFRFFFNKVSLIHYKQRIHIGFVSALDSPPPEYI